MWDLSQDLSRYICHLELDSEDVLSSFIWKNEIYSCRREDKVHPYTVQNPSENVKMILIGKSSNQDEPDLTRFKYDAKALKQFSKKAQSFLHQEKAEIKNNMRKFMTKLEIRLRKEKR